jgi:MFS family permease
VKQALLFNAIVFNYSLMLSKFFNIPLANLGWYFVALAAGNFLGPLVLGRLFDTFGRKEMIALTYAISGLLIAGSGYLFLIGAVSALTQCLAWMVTFFVASAAAIAAYLTAGVPARDPSSRESLSSLPSVPASAVSSVHGCLPISSMKGGKAFIWALLYSPQR